MITAMMLGNKCTDLVLTGGFAASHLNQQILAEEFEYLGIEYANLCETDNKVRQVEFPHFIPVQTSFFSFFFKETLQGNPWSSSVVHIFFVMVFRKQI